MDIGRAIFESKQGLRPATGPEFNGLAGFFRPQAPDFDNHAGGRAIGIKQRKRRVIVGYGDNQSL